MLEFIDFPGELSALKATFCLFFATPPCHISSLEKPYPNTETSKWYVVVSKEIMLILYTIPCSSKQISRS